jgi:hypothetical protein
MNTKGLLAAAAVLLSIISTNALAEAEAYSYENVREGVREYCVGADRILIDNAGYTYCVADAPIADQETEDSTVTGSVSTADEPASEAN